MSALPRLQYHLINAFTTDSPHSGNQAAVVLFPSSSDPRANDDNFLLTTAQDFGFAETAYLVPIDEKAGRWGLRWFTIFTVRFPLALMACLTSFRKFRFVDMRLLQHPRLSCLDTHSFQRSSLKLDSGGS
jgi:hypothetical protein